MKLLIRTSTFYAILGTVAAVFYLVFTKQHAFTGTSLLSSLCVFLFALGTVFHILLIVLDRLFEISKHKLYKAFFWIWNLGVLSSSVVMLGKGIHTVINAEPSRILATATGVGHTLTTVAGILFFIILNQVIAEWDK